MDYGAYALRENPFPVDAVINPFSADRKRNGAIFAAEARKDLIANFEGRLLGSRSGFGDRNRLGFVWAEGDRDTGRGIGKTALLLYMKHLINRSWREEAPGTGHRVISLYVSFDQQIKDYLVEHLCQLALVACLKDDVFGYLRTTRGITQGDLIPHGVSRDFADHIVAGDMRDWLESLRSDHSLEIPRPPRDLKLLNMAKRLFLSDTVAALEAGGFEGGILMVDDAENMIDQPGRKYLEGFAKDLGNAYLRADNTQARDQFFSLVFTTHSNAARRLGEAWKVSGLSAAYPLEPEGPSSVEVPKPSPRDALQMVRAYMEAYRVAGVSVPSPFHPFTEEAVLAVVSANSNHPRRYLSSLHRLLKEAVQKGIPVIDKAYVSQHLPAEGPVEAAHLPELDEL